MLDYMLPRKVMSWKEAFELYFEEQMLGGLFQDLAFYGITPPKHVDDAIAEKEVLSHQVYWTLYQFSHAAAFTTTMPDADAQTWLSENYADTFDKLYKPLWEQGAAATSRPVAGTSSADCPSCARSARSRCSSPSPATRRRCASASRTTRARRSRPAPTAASGSSSASPRSTSRRGCRCTRSTRATAAAPTIPDVLAWYGIQEGDSGEYKGSVDANNWNTWHDDADHSHIGSEA